MARFGFVGASYSSASLNADAQTCMNWVIEKVESDQGKGPLLMREREGLVLFCTLPTGPGRPGGKFSIDTNPAGRDFAVSGSVLYELFSNGTYRAIGDVGNDGGLITWGCNATNTQVALCSNGIIYVLSLTSGILTQIPPSTFSQGYVSMIEEIDDFFIALISNTNIFYNSSPDDATSWPGAQANEVSVNSFRGNIRAIKQDSRQLGILGKTRGLAYYNTGASVTPFSPIPGGNIQGGIAAPSTLITLDNTWFWLDQDERGWGIFRRYASGGPQRVSNHAIESAWSNYASISDAICFPYQNNGHSFAVLKFPSANGGRGATWAYDVATGLWGERDFWNAGQGLSYSYLPQAHSFCFGKHLVNDSTSGNIYTLSNLVISDNGNAMRRVRRAPHISVEQERQSHHSLQVDVEVGLGTIPPLLDGSGNARGPQLMLRWSDTSTKTWSNIYPRDCGQGGQYITRVIWRRIGQTRDRVYELSATDPVPMRIIDAYLKASGMTTQKRIVKELAERA